MESSAEKSYPRRVTDGVEKRGVARRRVERRGQPRASGLIGDSDEVAIEEPLEIRIDGETLAVTLRTPGDDARLALGFLYGEGIIGSLADVGARSEERR